ncbi:AraC family transcriptional regulator [Polyangium aurulentum]|uniref:AraC family transcriptional regulator n=1 Tax=Polyangium aurulentum TaxID=2567896 RepID=UPI0010ADE6FB|nr:AraC family transcriptional regulator [Polyangium aurulentum]UQA60453.1 AraC family transcriptional regulator [Polyangium aurulentum]
MSLVAKALWYIENNYARPDLSLDDVASACEASRFHLTRAFGVTTGRTLMRYLRARRITQAALALAGGAPDILAVALDAGYGSHEAFTRAFREQFGLTPEALRARGHCDGLELVPALRLDHGGDLPLAAPRLIDRRAFTIAGLSARYTHETAAGIPALWQRLASHPPPPCRVGPYEYGACVDTADGAFDYTCGIEIDGMVPTGLVPLHIPAQRYAVFFHPGHIAAIRMAWRAIYDRWLPASNLRAAGGADFERYDGRFDVRTGEGGVEIWISVVPR